MTLIEFLMPHHGGMSASKRLLQARAVGVNGVPVSSLDLILEPLDKVSVGRQWVRNSRVRSQLGNSA